MFIKWLLRQLVSRKIATVYIPMLHEFFFVSILNEDFQNLHLKLFLYDNEEWFCFKRGNWSFFSCYHYKKKIRQIQWSDCKKCELKKIYFKDCFSICEKKKNIYIYFSSHGICMPKDAINAKINDNDVKDVFCFCCF